MRRLETKEFVLTVVYLFLGILLLSGISINDAWSQQALDPCAQLEQIAPCPCTFSDVPQTSECWSNPRITFLSCDATDCTNTPTDICSLNINPAGEPELGVGTDATDPTDQVCFILNNESCGIQNELQTDLNRDQINTCLCRLAQYTNELALNTDIQIDPQMDTYSCEPSQGVGEGDGSPGGGCSIASSIASNSTIPVYLLVPAIILIARLWRRRTNKKHT